MSEIKFNDKLQVVVDLINKTPFNQVEVKDPVLSEEVKLTDTGDQIEVHNKKGKIAYIPQDTIEAVRHFKYSKVHIQGMQPGLNKIRLEFSK